MSTLTAEGIKALLPTPRILTTPPPEPEITTTAAPTANPSQPLLFDPDENVNMDPFGPIQGTGNQVGSGGDPAPMTPSPVTTAPPVILEPETTAPPEKSSIWLWVGLVACVLVVIIVLVVFATRGGSAPPPQQSFAGIV